MDLFLTKEALYRLSYVGILGRSGVLLSQVIGSSRTKWWSGRRGSNSRHSAWKAEALPTELLPPNNFLIFWSPASTNLRRQAYSMVVLLCTVYAGSRVVRSDTENGYLLHQLYSCEWWWGEDSNLRRLRRQIYSLFPLAAREPHHGHLLEPAEGLEPPTH
jgi:hypothetical protein